MKKQNWIDFERVELDSNDGVIIKRRLESNPEKNSFSFHNYFDIFLKIIGIAAIFFPLWMFYIQREEELANEKRKALSDSYLSFSNDITFLDRTDIDSSNYSTALNRIKNEYPIKFVLYSEDSFASDVKKLYYLKEISVCLSKVVRQIGPNNSQMNDAIAEIKKNLIISSGKYKIEINKWYRDSSKILAHLGNNRFYLLGKINMLYNDILIAKNNIIQLDSSLLSPRTRDDIDKILFNLEGIGSLLIINESLKGRVSKNSNDTFDDKILINLNEFNMYDFQEKIEDKVKRIQNMKDTLNKYFRSYELKFENKFLAYFRKL